MAICLPPLLFTFIPRCIKRINIYNEFIIVKGFCETNDHIPGVGNMVYKEIGKFIFRLVLKNNL